MLDGYDAHGRRWSQATVKLIYDATPAAAWAGVFWTALAAALGRTHDATYKTVCVRWGWSAKVDASKRELWADPVLCRDCRTTIDVRADKCVRCAGKARRLRAN